MFRSSEKKGCDVILWEVVWSECLLSLNVPTTCNSFSMHCIAFTINQTYCGKCMKKKPNNCTGGGGSRIWGGLPCRNSLQHIATRSPRGAQKMGRFMWAPVPLPSPAQTPPCRFNNISLLSP